MSIPYRHRDLLKKIEKASQQRWSKRISEQRLAFHERRRKQRALRRRALGTKILYKLQLHAHYYADAQFFLSFNSFALDRRMSSV
jgi:hypothetical protein